MAFRTTLTAAFRRNVTPHLFNRTPKSLLVARSFFTDNEPQSKSHWLLVWHGTHSFRSDLTRLLLHNPLEYTIPPEPKRLYEVHIPIPLRQKLLLAVGSTVTALRNPLRADMVAALGETTGHLSLVQMRDRMLQDPTGRRILRERPKINSRTIDLVGLRGLPDGTLGREYVRWLDAEGVSPDTRDQVRYVDSEELAYVMQRYRETHDFAHTLTGLGVTVESELVLKWFEWTQTGLPMTALSSLLGPLRLTSAERLRLFSHSVPWAVKCARGSKFFMCVYFEELFEKPLTEVRRDLGIYLLQDEENRKV